MNLNFLCSFLILVFTVSLLASQDEKIEKKFTVKSIGEVALKVESREEIRKKAGEFSVEGSKLHEEVLIDTYKLVSSDRKILWSRTESNPNPKLIGKLIIVRVYSVEYLNDKLFVAYSHRSKVWIDELSLDDKQNWKINNTIEVMPSVSFSPIMKCVISAHEADKKQVKFLFEVLEEGEKIFLYKDGVLEKVEKERKD